MKEVRLLKLVLKARCLFIIDDRNLGKREREKDKELIVLMRSSAKRLPMFGW